MTELSKDIVSSLNELKEYAEGKQTGVVVHHQTEVPFNLRGYIAYIDANHITDPDEIPDKIVQSFFHHEEEMEADK